MLYSKLAAKVVSCLLLIILTTMPVVANEIDFPVPDSIRPAISFWTKVYTQVDTQSGFLHDAHSLNIIYLKLNRDRTLIENSRKEIIADLKVLATGKRSNLSESQQGLLSLWGEDTTNARFEQAATNVRWQLGQSDRYKAGLVRSGAYREYIEQVVLDKKLPLELAALPHVESSFHPGAYSSAAASGMWQFVRETAQRFMQVDLVVDERLDPYIASNAAMELLKYNYDALGTWPLALTAYNHGTNGMARAVREMGTDDIGVIISDYKGSRFGFASRNFYPQFLAALDVERNALSHYGEINKDTYPKFSTVETNAFIAAADVAAAMNISIETLKRYNPALLPVVWTGNKRIPSGFQLKIDTAVFPGNMQASINSISPASFYTAQIPDVSYKVRSGDSLSVIADRFATSVSELVAINQLRDRHRIRVGQTIILPQPNGVVPTLVVNDTSTQSIPANGQYEVKRGDTISLIADRFELSADTLLALNTMDASAVIYPGQQLMLKPSAATVMPSQSVQQQLAVALNNISEPEQGAEVSNQEDSFVEDSEIETTQQAVILADAIATEDEEQNSVELLQASEDVLTTDPANFAVASDNSIEVLANETLGHYADWLQLPTSELRKLNGLSYNTPVKVGERLRLQFSKVQSSGFEQLRKQYHSDLQANYFASWRIRNTESYSIQSRDMLMNLTQKRSVPMWLFRQYNPGVNADRMQIGQIVIFPVVEKITN